MSHLARTGEPWRDLPVRFGNRDAVYQRFRRWEKAGRWRKLFERLPADLQEVRTIFLDSSVIRAHPHAAGAPGKRGASRPRPSGAAAAGSGPRSTRSPETSGRALAVALTPGQAGDAPSYPGLIAAVPEGCPVEAAAADKAYDSDAIRADLKARGIEPVIPPSANRKEMIPYDKGIYRQRNRVERLFSKLKQFRRVATRYDKLDLSFLAFIHLTATLVMIR